MVTPAARTHGVIIAHAVPSLFPQPSSPAQLDSFTPLPDAAAMVCGASASAFAASRKAREATVIRLPFACAFAIDAASQVHRPNNEGRLADAAGNAAACN